MEQEKYSSLLSIRARKSELQKQIDASEDEVKGIWNGIFHAPQPNSSSPTQKILSIVTSSAGLIDGALFGWKLYRKFKK